jgi:hypothetical protein
LAVVADDTGEDLGIFTQGYEIHQFQDWLLEKVAAIASPAPLRSYAYELLLWQRFLRAVDVSWHLAGRVEARDFALWLKTSRKPPRQPASTAAAVCDLGRRVVIVGAATA